MDRKWFVNKPYFNYEPALVAFLLLCLDYIIAIQCEATSIYRDVMILWESSRAEYLDRSGKYALDSSMSLPDWHLNIRLIYVLSQII